jgi:hypothetical protein
MYTFSSIIPNLSHCTTTCYLLRTHNISSMLTYRDGYNDGRMSGGIFVFTMMICTWIIAYIILNLLEPVTPNSCQKGV